MLLSLKESIALLNKYGIKYADAKVVTSVDQAVKFANRKYPVVLKIDSPDIIHKSDKGCVKTNIRDEKQLRKEYKEIMKNAGRASIRGMLVQKQVQGIEIIIGGKVDPQFGEVVMFGLGGIFVEILKDVSVRVTPITKKDAMQMITSIRGYKMLTGARGTEKADLNAIADTIVKVAKLHAKHKEITELDLNPAFAGPKGLVVADVRMIKNGP